MRRATIPLQWSSPDASAETARPSFGRSTARLESSTGLPAPMLTPKRAARHDPTAGRGRQGQVVVSDAPQAAQADWADPVANGEAEGAATGLTGQLKNAGGPAAKRKRNRPHVGSNLWQGHQRRRQ